MGLLDGVACEKEKPPVQATGCIACLEKDDRYPHTCNKGANNMTEREQEIIIKLIDNNVGRSDYVEGCKMICYNVPCYLCPVDHYQKITLGEIRAMDPRKITPEPEEQEEPEVTPTDDQPSAKSIEGVTKPSHYMLFDDIEAIEVIARSMTREQFKGYCFGNILKYRLRAGKKSELAYLEKDMAKAKFYGELYEKHKDKCYDAW